MLVDASVARSFAVVGWTDRLVRVTGGPILVGEGVHGVGPSDPSELRRIRDALQRQAHQAGIGSGLASRALAAAHVLDELLALSKDKLVVLSLTDVEFELAVRLQSRRPSDRQWRRSLGASARRLDAGESASVAIAATRSLGFASDDEDALTLWEALTATPGLRSRDLLWRLVMGGVVAEADARAVYHVLQTDDLHNLGGPPW